MSDIIAPAYASALHTLREHLGILFYVKTVVYFNHVFNFQWCNAVWILRLTYFLRIGFYLMVKCSSISSHEITEEFVRNLISMFQDELKEILLFVNNVQTVRLSEIVSDHLEERMRVHYTKKFSSFNIFSTSEK
jgi:hypothetical protein